jgi:hypothetical protein
VQTARNRLAWIGLHQPMKVLVPRIRSFALGVIFTRMADHEPGAVLAQIEHMSAAID